MGPWPTATGTSGLLGAFRFRTKGLSAGVSGLTTQSPVAYHISAAGRAFKVRAQTDKKSCLEALTEGLHLGGQYMPPIREIARDLE